MNYPKPLEDLIQAFMKYPGVGRKTAERYALFTVNAIDSPTAAAFADALKTVKTAIRPCSICGHMTDIDPCSICANPHRDRSKILVLESAKDVFSIEKSGNYKGLYHVLNGVISPLNGFGPEDINLASLVSRVQDDAIGEIILATSATQEGEATAMYIHRILKSTDLTVSRIAYGVPVGANLEYADEITLTKAIENRRVF
ncbi:MAG: recombination mediator RecR [Bacillus subtilis]|nr:recombination mediator RecR [Bacillus subtilis]